MSESSGPQTFNVLDHWRVGSVGRNMVGAMTKIDKPDENGDGEVRGAGRVGRERVGEGRGAGRGGEGRGEGTGRGREGRGAGREGRGEMQGG